VDWHFPDEAETEHERDMLNGRLERLRERVDTAFAVATYDPETRRRMATSVGLRLLALGPPFIALYFYLDLPLAGWILTAAEGLNAGALLGLHRRKDPVLCGWVIVLALIGAIFGTLYTGGGLRSPGSPWLLLGPLIGCYLFGFRGAAVTVCLTVSGIGMYALWEQMHGIIPHMIPAPYQNAWNFLVVATAVLATLSITNSWMAMLHSMQRQQEETERAFGKAIDTVAEAIFVFARDARTGQLVARLENAAGARARQTLAECGTDLAGLLGVEQVDERTLADLAERTADAPIQVSQPGGGVWYDVRVSGFRGGFALCLQDVSEHVQVAQQLRKASQEALEANRLKSEFLATMSHEIRTPMNGILGMTELALQSRLDADQRDCLNTIQECADNLLHLINDILDLSKIEAGKVELEAAPFDLLMVLEGVQDSLSPKASQKRLDWNSFARAEVPTQLIGDPLRLRQVLLNLASNAIKFTEHGEVSLEVSFVARDSAGARLKFSVRDSGIGIAPEARARLFQKFSQADSSTTRKYGGTGLGLTISRQLVQLMGGDIEVESQPGAGSTFAFTIPLQVQPSTGTQPAASDLLVGRRVLVLDDLETNRRVLAGQARRLGCRYDVCASADEAESLLARAHEQGDPFFCVWGDYCMPGRDGRDFARSVRNDSRHAHVRLLLLSSYLHELGGEHAAHAAGFDLQLAKPVKLAQLREAMTRLVLAPAPLHSAPRAGPHSASVHPPPATVMHLVAGAEAAPARILIAEDNAVNRKLALRMLQNAGYTAQIAENGVQAVAAAGAAEFDLILMDCQMPEMDGLAATRAIRALGGRNAEIPVVALTANAMVGDRERCLAAGMNDYLSKPLLAGEFTRMLERWLGRAQPLRHS
jgi:signal transduction histidine kinase/DNA-binding response OmpR family regulator